MSIKLYKMVMVYIVFNETFNNISAILLLSVYLEDETRASGENRQPVTDKLYHMT